MQQLIYHYKKKNIKGVLMEWMISVLNLGFIYIKIIFALDVGDVVNYAIVKMKKRKKSNWLKSWIY